jgi:outer membrane protein OmpA-like peptidoglycan-associated protein
MKKLFTSILILFCLQPGVSQHYLGIATGNLAGTNSLYFNPSSIADTRQGFYLNLFSANTYFTNNYAAYKTGKTIQFDSTAFDFNNSGQAKQALAGMEIRGPALMIKMSPKHSFALATRVRVLGQLTDVSEDLVRLTANADNLNSFYNVENLDTRFRITANAFSEISLTYARVAWEKDRHFLKAGITLKKLSGIYAAYAVNRKADFTINREPDPNTPLDEQDAINIRNLDLSYAYTDANALTGTTDQSLTQLLQNNWTSYLLGNNAIGKGFGWDIGATYEYRPNIDKLRYTMNGKSYIDHKAVKYMLRVGLALTDMGRMRFSSPFITAYDINVQNKSIKTEELQDASDTDFLSTINTSLGVNEDEKSTEFTMNLPAALSTNVDYHLTGKLFLNATWIQNLTGKNKIAMRQSSVLAITPRLETKVFGLSFPVSVVNGKSFAAGGMFRLGPFFVGSDNVAALVGGKIYGLDAYAGFTLLQIQSNKKDDRDNDGVSDKEDKCPDSPGAWDLLGCPDSDGDGIKDENDRCPGQAGLTAYEGCPDTDGDQIEDSKDDCPEAPGLLQFNGCPDADEDGVVDKKDECPGVKGLSKFYGCPDTDGDEIPDKDDNCPEVRGLLRFGGCPDTDNDGIQDAKDKCPQVAGIPQFDGCPDTDGDGIPSPADECPEQSGIPAFKGCPDSDGDGIADKNDECPQEYGVADNNGCPETEERKKNKALALKAEFKTIADEAAREVEFEPGKAVILLKSYPILDEMADFLNLHTGFKLFISAHTDNTGSLMVNLKLSKDRAEAVKSYLAKNGVSGKNLTSQGFGSSKPLTGNKTPEGRKKNRRIEFRMSEK